MVVFASMGSEMMMPVSNRFLLSEWLIMYMWSVVARGPLMRSTLHGNVLSVTENGVSQIIGNSGRM